MVQPLHYLKESASQTAGPYVHIGLTPNFCDIAGVYPQDLGTAMVNERTLGDRITVTGRVIDGAGAPLRDALVEIWQADGNGFHNSPSELRGAADPNFTGWGRCPTSFAEGLFRFETVRPGRVPFRDGRLMAPHISFWIVARGINTGLQTRMYFPEETEANAADPVLARIEHRDRVKTLVATGAAPEYHFDIRLQGPDETVFFDL
jgi:protocatechuate 3,4-dioxygenase alpha subunit